MPLHNLSLIFIGMKQIFELKIGGLVQYDFFKWVKSDLLFTKFSGIDPHESLVD